MHGSVHDFVVLKTIKNGGNCPSGFGNGTRVSDNLDIEELTTQPYFKNVLDIGSLDINGSMKDYDFCGTGLKWREMIRCKEYIGIDMLEGPKVDSIMNAHNLQFPDNSFDLVLCTSMLEHDTEPQSTIFQAKRVLKKGQPFILTTVDENHEEHKHLGGGDTETYNFITDTLLIDWLKKADFSKIKVYHKPTDLFAYCIK